MKQNFERAQKLKNDQLALLTQALSEQGMSYTIARKRIRDRFDDTKGLSWEELTKKDIYIFRLETSKKVVRNEALSKNFKKLLQRCDLLKDEFGNDRVLYSLRHTYASRRRYDGMSYDDLSVVMGTSTELLRKVYSHFEATDNPNLFSGHLRRQKKVAEDTEAEWKIKLEKSLEKQATQIEKLLEQNAELTDKLIQTKN